MSAITSHVLDTARGRPAEGVPVLLERETPERGWHVVGQGFTDSDGRVTALTQSIEKGMYRITFDTSAYYTAQGTEGFYPRVSVTFHVTDPEQHYHVPLLLSPYGYSTYRGS